MKKLVKTLIASACLALTLCLANPFQPVMLTQVDVRLVGEGAHDPVLQKTVATFPLRAGQLLVLARYQAAKENLMQAAEHQGYARASFQQHQILVDRQKHQAQIHLILDTGPRYYFGGIHYQPSPLSEDLLKRIAPIKTGNPYNTSDVVALQEALNNSNYFQQVSVSPHLENPREQHIPIDVTLVPRHRQQLSFGAGYGTDTGARGSAGWDWRYLTPQGDRLSALVRLSQIQNNYQIIYTYPGEHPLTDQYNVTAGFITNEYPPGKSYTQKLAVGRIKAYDHWQHTLSLANEFEHDSLQTTVNDYRLLMPTLAWQYLNSDDPLFPRHGHRFNFSMQGAAHHLLSNSSLIQMELQEKYICWLDNIGRLLLRGDFGSTVVKDWSNRLPLTLSFFTGGAQSVRGYSYQSLGPGRYLAVGSVEFQPHITGNWYGSFFYDAGNAFNDFPSTNLLGLLNRGIGVGLVWASPIGPLNLSIARAVSLPDHPMQIQFSMGPDL